MRALKDVLVLVSVALAIGGFMAPAATIALKPDLLKHLQSQGKLATSRLAAKNIRLALRRGGERLMIDTESLPSGTLKLSAWQFANLSDRQLTQVALAMIAWQLKQPSAASVDLLDRVFDYQQQVKRYSRAVYLVPGLVASFALLLYLSGWRRWAAGGVGFVCAILTAVGCWKMSRLALPPSFGSIQLNLGIWLALGGYAGLTIASALGLMRKRRKMHEANGQVRGTCFRAAF